MVQPRMTCRQAPFLEPKHHIFRWLHNYESFDLGFDSIASLVGLIGKLSLATPLPHVHMLDL